MPSMRATSTSSETRLPGAVSPSDSSGAPMGDRPAQPGRDRHGRPRVRPSRMAKRHHGMTTDVDNGIDATPLDLQIEDTSRAGYPGRSRLRRQYRYRRPPAPVGGHHPWREGGGLERVDGGTDRDVRHSARRGVG